MMKCLHCEATEGQVKAGKNDSGSQRMQCRQCGHRYTPEPKAQGYPKETRQQAIGLYVDGMNLRRTARHMGIHHKTVMLWVAAHAEQLPEAPLPDTQDIVEQDELFSFIGNKKTKSTS